MILDKNPIPDSFFTLIAYGELTPEVPCPNCPRLFLPQTQTVPSHRKARQKTPPAEMDLIFFNVSPSSINTYSGYKIGLSKFPVPVCPKTLFPQLNTLPSSVKAYEEKFPVEI